MSRPDLFRGRLDGEVFCVACGATVPRTHAREYDKYGDRWEREGKDFEYLCKPCHRDSCHQNRDGLEELLVEAGAGQRTLHAFLRRYDDLVTDDTVPTDGS